jgi:HD-GYP domain-containing protein (c-di-GMP phosphodiesterase class II)
MTRTETSADDGMTGPKSGSSIIGDECHAITRRLSREFGAPIGMLDPSTWTWRFRLGMAVEHFPELDAKLGAVLTSTDVTNGRAAVWRAGSESAPLWLVLPVARTSGGYWLALLGFAADAATGAGWGPICPEPALRAWGQTVAERLRTEAGLRQSPDSPSARGDGSERLLIARLIRRLKISDPPERFQSLAVNALRNALGAAAVAWVPGAHGEQVMISGEIAGLKPNDYRSIIPPSRHDAVSITNDWDGPPEIGLKRLAVVAAETQGSTSWLLAANPAEGRSFEAAELEILQPVASLIATQQTNARLYADLKELLFGVIRALTAAIDAKDPYTSGHSERVARIADRLAKEMGMPANQRSDLYLMGLLHDVGKIGVDDFVLKKTGPLTPDEYRLIQSHVEIGVHILSDLKKLHHLLPGVLHHHESLDGSGYPAGLAGDAIPFEARILAVADAFDAMSSTRPYRKRMTPGQIDEIFTKGAGVQWDPKIVEALFACRVDVDRIRQKGLGESLQLIVSDTLGRS